MSERPPSKVYHGTSAGGFTQFRPFQRKGEQLGFGIHFAEDKDLALLYASDPSVARRAPKGSRAQVYTARIAVDRPLIANAIVYEGSPEFALARKLAGRRLLTQTDTDGRRMAYMQHALDFTSADRAEREVRAAGYDAVRYDAQLATPTGYGMRRTGGGTAWIVFAPEQVQILQVEDVGTPRTTKHNPESRGADAFLTLQRQIKANHDARMASARRAGLRVSADPEMVQRAVGKSVAIATTKIDVRPEDGFRGARLEPVSGGRHTRGQYALIHPSTKAPGEWQLTWMDQDGAVGDTRRKDVNDLFAYAGSEGFQVVEAHMIKRANKRNPGRLQLPSGRAIKANPARGGKNMSKQQVSALTTFDVPDEGADWGFWIGEVVDHLAAELPGAEYDHDYHMLSIPREGDSIGTYAFTFGVVDGNAAEVTLYKFDAKTGAMDEQKALMFTPDTTKAEATRMIATMERWLLKK